MNCNSITTEALTNNTSEIANTRQEVLAFALHMDQTLEVGCPLQWL